MRQLTRCAVATALGLPILLALGCTYVVKTPLPVDAAILKAKRNTDRPKLFLDERVDWNSLPFMIPYLLVSITHDNMRSRDTIARRLWWHGDEAKADIVRVLQAEARPPNLQTTAVCYRLAPCKLGFTADDHGFVLDAGSARSSGLLEGDRILSYGGAPFEMGHTANDFRFYNRIWSFKAGDAVELVWIRPGMGKIQKMLTCESNDASHLQITDSIEWKPPPPKD